MKNPIGDEKHQRCYGIGAKHTATHGGHGLNNPALPMHAAKHPGIAATPMTGITKPAPPQQAPQQAAQAPGPAFVA